jgi:hypothetical protein
LVSGLSSNHVSRKRPARDCPGNGTHTFPYFPSTANVFPQQLAIPHGFDRCCAMKKHFPLTAPNHQPARVVEQIKGELRKYLKRERKKTLPEGADFWDFDCKVSGGQATPQSKHLEEIGPAIDAAAAAGCDSVYIEIIAKPAHRSATKN